PGDVGCFDDLGDGSVRTALAPGGGSRYYLVTGYRGADQGPAGNDGAGVARDPAQQTCTP
ncbi:MAG TPA: hypothetical protein VD788_11150, partial [Candidatus Polarisedimenticolaceae bacterium]|nr:hypothetical protein [Candidatus Polarisedimenticolaceae bacterium]